MKMFPMQNFSSLVASSNGAYIGVTFIGGSDSNIIQDTVNAMVRLSTSIDWSSILIIILNQALFKRISAIQSGAVIIVRCSTGSSVELLELLEIQLGA